MASHAKVVVAELNCLHVEVIELVNRQQQARPAGEFGVEYPPESVDGVQVVKIKRGDDRAAAGSNEDEPFCLEASQCLANRDQADIEHRGDLPQRELLSRGQHSRKYCPA